MNQFVGVLIFLFIGGAIWIILDFITNNISNAKKLPKNGVYLVSAKSKMITGGDTDFYYKLTDTGDTYFYNVFGDGEVFVTFVGNKPILVNEKPITPKQMDSLIRNEYIISINPVK